MFKIVGDKRVLHRENNWDGTCYSSLVTQRNLLVGLHERIAAVSDDSFVGGDNRLTVSQRGFNQGVGMLFTADEFNDNIYDDKKYAEAAGLAIRYLKEYVFYLVEEERKAKEKAEEVKEEK